MHSAIENPKLKPADWLLVETVRRAEESADRFIVDDPATLAARNAAGNPTGRILARARGQRDGKTVMRAAGLALAGLRGAIGLLWLLGLLAGIGAAGSLPAHDGILALSHALVVLVLLPSLLLMLWLVLSLWPGRGPMAGGLPGRMAWSLSAFAANRLGRESWRPHLAAALASYGRHHGRSLMALASHGFWAAFFFGCIGWLWLRFLGLRFDFSWESTLLAGASLHTLIDFLGALPKWLFGITLPDQEQVAMVLQGSSAAQDRALWAAWLLAVLAAWGLLPRLLLLVGLILKRARPRLVLDLSEPGYMRLLPALAGPSADTPVKHGPRPADPDRRPRGARASPGPGAAVLIGVELDPDGKGWPPTDTSAKVLGRADDRQQRQGIRQALELLQPKPARIIARCSAQRTPDRGIGRWLAELAQLAPIEIELAESEDLAESGIEPEARIADWQRMATRYGVGFREISD